MDHSEAVIGPHVVKAMSCQFASTIIQIAVGHVTVTKYGATLGDVFLH